VSYSKNNLPKWVKAMTDGTISFKKVTIKNIYGVENPGQMKVITRDLTQRFVRTGRRSGKIILMVVVAIPFIIFVHALLLVSLLAILVAAGLFFWGLGDRVTFEWVEGDCPKCKVSKKLTPFATSRANFPVQIHCADCGEVFTATEND